MKWGLTFDTEHRAINKGFWHTPGEVWTGQPPPGLGWPVLAGSLTTRRSSLTSRRSPSKRRKRKNDPPLSTDPGVPSRDLRSGSQEKHLTVFAICPWPNPVFNRLHADLNAPTNRAGTCPVSRLYGHVRDCQVKPDSSASESLRPRSRVQS